MDRAKAGGGRAVEQPASAGQAPNAPPAAEADRAERHRSPSAHDLWTRGFNAWERVAADAARAIVGDPRTLELGAAALRAHLAWRKAMNETLAASMAPWQALREDRSHS